MDCAIGVLDPECVLDATVHTFGDQEGDHQGFNLDPCARRTFRSLDVPMAPVGSGPFTANDPAKNTACMQTKHAHFTKAGGRRSLKKIKKMHQTKWIESKIGRKTG